MLRLGWRILAACALALPLTGCLSQQAQQIQMDITALRDSLEVSYARQDALHDKLVDLEGRLSGQEDLLGRLRAEHQADVEEISGRLGAAETNEAEEENRLEHLTRRVDSLERRSPAGVVSDSTGAAAGAGTNQAYDRAYLDFSRGNYDLAIMGFTEYLRTNPGGDRADNAQYWIGECQYVQGKYEQAIAAYQKVLDGYPGGNKAPAAMLKMGYALAALDRRPDAVRQLKTVIDRYPGTPEAEHAREKLLSMNE
jgi:tol-pal system protein YbgF